MTSPLATISLTPADQGSLRVTDNPDHILESAAAYKIRNYRDTSTQSTGGLFTGVHVYIGTYPWLVLALALLPLQSAIRRLLCSSWIRGTQGEVLPSTQSLLPPQLVHHWHGMLSGCVVAWRPHHSSSLAACHPHTSPPITFPGPPMGRVARVAILF